MAKPATSRRRRLRDTSRRLARASDRIRRRTAGRHTDRPGTSTLWLPGVVVLTRRSAGFLLAFGVWSWIIWPTFLRNIWGDDRSFAPAAVPPGSSSCTRC